MFDLKQIGLVLQQLEEEKGVKKDQIIEAIGSALASAYKKEFGKRGQVIRGTFDLDSGKTEYVQVKTVVDKNEVIILEEGEVIPEHEVIDEESQKVRYNSEQHIFLEQARLIKANTQVGDELIFPLEHKTDFSRVAAQTAKQVIIQKIREAEKGFLSEQFGDKYGKIISGTVQRVERGTIFVDLGKAEGTIPFTEQIRNERYKTGDRISGYLYSIDEGGRGGVSLKISRTHPELLRRLFEREVPELNDKTIELKAIAREPGMRSKVAVWSRDEDVDPIGALVGQNGSRVQTVTSELSGERIDIIEWSEDMEDFIRQALSPAEILSLTISEEAGVKKALVKVSEDQFSLAIGRGGQNVRLAARLTGHKIDIQQVDAQGNVIEPRPKEERMAEKAAMEQPEVAEQLSAEMPAEEETL